MKFLTSGRSLFLLALCLPLSACDTTQGLFSDQRSSSSYKYIYDKNHMPMNAPQVRTADTATNANTAVKAKSDVTMVEHGVSTATTPKPASMEKSTATKESPMVPGGAPSVE